MRYIQKTKFESIMKEIVAKPWNKRIYKCQNDRHSCGQLFTNKTKFRQHIESNCFVFHCTYPNCHTTRTRFDNYLKHVNKFKYHSK